MIKYVPILFYVIKVFFRVYSMCYFYSNLPQSPTLTFGALCSFKRHYAQFSQIHLIFFSIYLIKSISIVILYLYLFIYLFINLLFFEKKIGKSCYPRPSTLALDPRPSTLDPRPSTLDPRPSTLDPRPSTLDPRPSTKR